MMIDLIQGLIGGIIATIVWFFIGAIVYMNPFVAKIYKKYEEDPGVKNRKDVPGRFGGIILMGTVFLFANGLRQPDSSYKYGTLWVKVALVSDNNPKYGTMLLP